MSIHGPLQENQVYSFIRERFAPGGNSNNPTNMFYWIGLRQNCRNCGFTWSDHSSVEYLNWKPNEPNDANEEKDALKFCY